jgi:hypothetical protein
VGYQDSFRSMAAARRRFRSVEAVGLDFVHSKWTGESIVAVVVSTQSRVRMRKQSFSLLFLLKLMGLPRQAWDQHRESTQKQMRFLR